MCILYKGLKKKCDKWFYGTLSKKIRETTVVTVVSLMVFASY